MPAIERFQIWFAEQLKQTKVRLPAACCLSTIGLDGFPNSRFVSLKEIYEGCFIVTGTLSSRKGLEIEKCNQVSLTFWWTETERQIRIQGFAEKISEQLADRYFSERNKDSQIVSIVSRQGEDLGKPDELIRKYEALQRNPLEEHLQRPADWGGYAIRPVRIEFLQFMSTRFHQRQLYELVKEKWQMKYLQP